MTRWPEDAPLPSDAVIAAVSGDETALYVLFRSFRPLVHRVALRVPTQYREDAEGDIYLQLLVALASYQPFAGKSCPPLPPDL